MESNTTIAGLHSIWEAGWSRRSRNIEPHLGLIQSILTQGEIWRTLFATKGIEMPELQSTGHSWRNSRIYALTHYNLANALKAKGDLTGAIGEYRAAVKLQPTYADAHHNLGTSLLAINDTKGAIAELRASLQFRPNNALAHGNLGNALAAEGDLNAAIQEYETTLRIKPDFAAARQCLEEVLRHEVRLQSQMVSSNARYGAIPTMQWHITNLLKCW